MSQSKHPPTKRRTGNQPAKQRSPNGAETQPGMRRFTPTPKTAADGGAVYGLLVADRRTALGMSREELAAKIQASPSAVMRIEEGHPPSAEIREKLTATLNPEPPGALQRLAARALEAAGAVAAGVGLAFRARRPTIAIPSHSGQAERRPQLHLDKRWLLRALGGVLIILAMIIGGWFSSTDGGPSLQPSVAVSHVLGAPASIQRARVHFQREARAEARRAAKRAAAAAAAAAAARRAAAKAAHRKAAGPTPTVIQPVSPSLPSSTGGGGGGGGGSSAPAPQLNHGIGSAGEPQPGTGSTGSGQAGGGSSPPPSSSCVLSGVLC